jgi:hypothetical protein
MRRLIYVHGINNQEYSRDQISDAWSNALKGTLGQLAAGWWGEIEVRTAYYADILHKEEQSWDGLSDAVVAMGADSPNGDYVPDEVAALYLEMQRGLGITDQQVEAELEPGEQLTAATRMGAGIHKSWLKAITRALEKVAPGAGNGLARRFLRQAATYLNKPGIFGRINETVREQVLHDLGDTDRTVVIGHSLGTIVTYVLLRSMSDVPKLPLFVTLGSPLGIRIVRDRIAGPYICPAVAMTWINGSDPEDFVALHPSLNSTTFGPAKVTNIPDLDNGSEM